MILKPKFAQTFIPLSRTFSPTKHFTFENYKFLSYFLTFYSNSHLFSLLLPQILRNEQNLKKKLKLKLSRGTGIANSILVFFFF